jgi:DNA end-binding protein Ku
MPQGDGLILMLLRFEEELIETSEYKLPAGNAAEYRVNDKELTMAKQLIESMADKWKPENFRDEFKKRLSAVIEKRLKKKGLVSNVERKDEAGEETATTNVVDFMSLLQKSLASNKRTPAKTKKAPARKTVKKPATKSSSTKKVARRKSA